MASVSTPNLSLLEKAERIYKAALAEVEPENLIKESISIRGEKLIVQDRKFNLDSFNDIFLVSIGKAAPFMAKSIMEILGNRVGEGIAVCLPQTKISLRKITWLPDPESRSVKKGIFLAFMPAGWR